MSTGNIFTDKLVQTANGRNMRVEFEFEQSLVILSRFRNQQRIGLKPQGITEQEWEAKFQTASAHNE